MCTFLDRNAVTWNGARRRFDLSTERLVPFYGETLPQMPHLVIVIEQPHSLHLTIDTSVLAIERGKGHPLSLAFARGDLEVREVRRQQLVDLVTARLHLLDDHVDRLTIDVMTPPLHVPISAAGNLLA